ncbi:hypothetical protein SAMN04488689_11942 [Paenibacillus sp. cl6col]|nr:hypothetical protein SAMN04488689_11942 [Paenibacillus sp. cl6col]
MLHQEMEDGRYQIAVVALDELFPKIIWFVKLKKSSTSPSFTTW